MTASRVALDAAWDELHRNPRFRPLYPSEWVVRFMNRHFADRACDILDVGCGAGRHSVLAAEMGHRVAATDLSPEGLRETRQRLEAVGASASTVHEGTFTELPFDDASFDGVVCYGVLCYGDRATFRRGVDEIRRVLRPGGWMQAVVRTTRDHRFGRGAAVEPHTFLLDLEETNEVGMLMHFLDRPGLDAMFEEYAEVVVEQFDHTAGGGAIFNSDWVIEARR